MLKHAHSLVIFSSYCAPHLGASFGVVTHMVFSLHEALPFYGGKMEWPIDKLPQVFLRLPQAHSRRTHRHTEAISTRVQGHRKEHGVSSSISS